MDGTASPPELTRRRFSSAEVERMVEIGLLSKEDHVELIHGELIEMGKQGPAHWNAVQRLVNWLLRRLPETSSLASQGPLRLADGEEPEPDIYLFPAALNVNAVKGPDVTLVVEIADTSLAKDRDIKAPLFAAYGVREYWIVVLETRETLVHRLDAGGYGEPARVAFAAALSVPGIAERLVLEQIL